MRTILSLAVLGLAITACGGGGGGGGSPAPAAGTATGTGTGTSTGGGTTTPPASSGAPQLVQKNMFQTPAPGDQTAGDASLQFNSATKPGDAIWVAVTVPTYGGVHTISVSDTQGNTYTKLDQIDDLGPGKQTVAHFFAGNILGDTGAADTIHVTWGTDNYQGVLIVELSGVTQAPLVGHNALLQPSVAQGTDNVNSGPVQVDAIQTPALVLALSMNTSGGTSDVGGSGLPGPAAGTGLTQVLALWNWGKPLATFATGTVTTAESVTSVFSSMGQDSFVTVAAIFH